MHFYHDCCGDRFRAAALPYSSAMAFVYVHVECTVPAIKAVLCIEINQCCHSCRRLFPLWWPRSGCTRCAVHCSSVHSYSSCRFQQCTSLSPSPISPMWESFASFRFNKRTLLSLSQISPEWGFFHISQCTAHRLQFLFFLKHFRSDFASKSTNNSILLERGRSYHSTLFFILHHSFSCTL